MEAFADIPLITTIGERCRVCYTCVRECPAKAIRIKNGQAAVLEERCIGCGNCVQVCSQRAKQFRRCTDVVRRLLARPQPVAVCLAPSFPAEFTDVPVERLVGMLRRLGFATVHELAFGADLVARRYRRLLAERPAGQRYIATTCPAVVGFVERYHPDLVPALAPVVSPMVAAARALRALRGGEVRVVFVGPCLAKKREAHSRAVHGEIDAAITFQELRELFAEAGVRPEEVEPGCFDPPHPGRGVLFALSRGLLEAAGMDQGLAAGEVLVAEGRSGMVEAIEDFEKGHVDVGLLEVLACRGCVMGPGMSRQESLFSRHAAVAAYARGHLRGEGADEEAPLARLGALALERGFAPHDQRVPAPDAQELAAILARMGKRGPDEELNCGACGYETCRAHARAIFAGLAESEMCLPYTINELQQAIGRLALSSRQLAEAQRALLHAEKLASMGQLAAGIAHELNNPLGVVLMYAHLLLDECPRGTKAGEDLALIAEQADRCKHIVAGLLNFSRQNKVIHQPQDLGELVRRSVEALGPPEGVQVRLEGSGDPQAELDRDQMAQVVTNLVANAFDAMPQGGTLTVATGGDAKRVWVRVEDTGVGIAPEHRKKLFEPFFTTKPMGKGTGLGLAVTYGIVKMHRGDIEVESHDDPSKGPTGTRFTVTVPRQSPVE